MKRIELLLLAATSFAVPACSNSVSQTGGGGDDDTSGSGDEWDQALASRVVDYPAALRAAALRLTGDLPTVAETNSIVSAADDAGKKAAYEGLITQYLGRPTFANQIFEFWQNTMKQGDTPALDSAPALAAQITVNNLSYMNLFTQNANTLVTFDPVASTFTAAAPANGGPVAGVLTDAGVHTQYFSNFAFRRVRWIQEVWDCARFPAEVNPNGGTDVGGASLYTGVWSFNSIASPTNGGGRVNFQDTSAVICANCHTTINHIAPLFANYDMNGVFQTTISAPTPLPNNPLAKLSDYLPPGETTAWRYQKPAADIPSFGTQMSQDPSVAACGVARIWNWALGKTDITDTLQVVPTDTIQTQLDAFTAGGFKMKDLVFAVFTSDDFVKF